MVPLVNVSNTCHGDYRKHLVGRHVMSRGPGRIQTKILRILAGNPDRTWPTDDLAAEIYGIDFEAVEKKHRVALLRAIRTMELPYGWDSNNAWLPQIPSGTPYRILLTNRFSVESMLDKISYTECAKASFGGDGCREIRPALAERIRRDVALNCQARDAETEEELDAIHAERRANLAADEEEYDRKRADDLTNLRHHKN
jgi:hypothetical protein